MAVLTPNGLTAVNLFSLSSGGGTTVLWTRAFGTTAAPFARRQVRTTPFGDQIKQFLVAAQPAQRNRPELRLGPIVGNRLILLQGGDLMAIDVLTNDTLWRNANAPQSGFIVGQGNRIAVVSPIDKRVDYFDLLNGQKLESSQWEYGPVWASAGAHVLAYSATSPNGVHQVRLVDPIADRVVLEHESRAANDRRIIAPGGYGRVVDGRYLAMLDSEGNAIVWDIRQGLEICRTKLAEQNDLQRLHAMTIGDQLMLFSERRKTKSDQPVTRNLMTQVTPDHVTVHAVHAISLTDGTVRWEKDFSEPWGCTITQPPGTPLLLLSRLESVYRNNTTRRNTLSILGLDVRDGNEAVPETSRPVKTSHNSLQTRVTVEEPASRMIAKVGSETLTFTFEASGKAETE